MLIDLALSLIAALLVIPLISGYYAVTHGRSFWLWFFIGCILPIFSYFLLLILPDKTHPLERELEEIRIRNKMLGTKPSLPAKHKKILSAPESQAVSLSFLLKTENTEIFVEPVINGVLLSEKLTHKKPAAALKGLPLQLVKFPSYHFLGKPHLFYQSKSGKSAIMMSKEGNNTEHAALYCLIECFPQHIVWSGFEMHPSRTTLTGLPASLLFNKVQYLDALEALNEQNANRL